MGIVDRLQASEEPSIRFLTRTGALGEDPASPSIKELQAEIACSPRAQALLSERDPAGRIPKTVYNKWRGAHWVISMLADIGYPAGDVGIKPLIDQVLGSWLSERHLAAVATVDGRVRRCASQEGNALWSALKLGISDKRTDELARRLALWQWPDGGWNCDRHPKAAKSSFHETLIPLRALSLHARVTGNSTSSEAVRRAAEPFLTRSLMKRLRDSRLMRADFLRLQYPAFWHYDVLSGLRVMAEAGVIGDPRCGDALDWLESRRLPDGGWPATYTYCRPGKTANSTVSWGGVSPSRANEWVTVHALTVLRAAGRVS